MNQATRLELVLPAGIAALLGLLWIVGPQFEVSWPLRASFAGTLLAAGVGLAFALNNRRAREEQIAQRALAALCRAEEDDANLEASQRLVSTMQASSRWREVFAQIQTTLCEQRERLHEAEHARARAEVRLRRLTVERDQLTEVLAGLPDPVLAIDHFDELLLANTSAERLFSIPAIGAEHQAVESLLRCQELVDLLTDTRRRKTPSQRSGELALADESGETHWYKVTCRSLANTGESGDTAASHGAVAVLSDISNQKAIQKRNAEFVSAASHEMKAPLSGIKAYVEMLVDGDAEDEATREEFLGVINSQADRLQRLIDNLLNLARIEAGVVNVQKESQSLNGLLDEALDVIQPAAEHKQIKLCRDLSPLYLGVLADRDMLLQAAINLLSNAIKYTPDGGRVTLRSRLTDDELSFEVEDTGVGLSPEDAHRVFEKFYRVKKDRQMAPGTGLGLPLAKHIVEDVHGGRLTVESELGTGSTFRVTLPAPEQLKG